LKLPSETRASLRRFTRQEDNQATTRSLCEADPGFERASSSLCMVEEHRNGPQRLDLARVRRSRGRT
jgi:hypothetical protein